MKKLFLASDLHGSKIVMNKVTMVPTFYSANSVVLAGDLTGKFLVPIIRGDKELTFDYFGIERTSDESKLSQITEELRNSGYYYTVVTKEEYQDLKENRNKQRQLFLEEMRKDLTAFVTKAESKLKAADAYMYVIPGNDDFPEVADFIQALESDRFIPFEGKSVAFDSATTMTGYGYTNPTPWHTPREKSEEEMYKDLTALIEQTDPERTLLVTHAPPYGTIIDRAPRLTGELKPVVVGGQYDMVSVGSISVRRIIGEYGPVAGLHGHIHEAQGADYINHDRGRTPVFNPGSEYGSGVLKGVLLLVEENQVKNYLFTHG